ncbi:BREX system serine/threonine kinase PglW [Pseudonocardia xishanensis]|uniref:non-specific serine/threonine protein kinase n=1 Tax=Pseudonocardia xishanensis TaxID=630995 RepID=A0ABP8RDI6_9PSEU
MEANSSRWHEITPSSFAHEQAALRYVRDLLPDRPAVQAWSNFTFVSDQGHLREVDLLVLTETGLHLVEIKNFRGRLSNRGSTWALSGGRTFDNPLPLADQKAKELKSLLARAAAKDRGIRIPYVSSAVFLAEPGMQCELDDAQRHHLYAPDNAKNDLPRLGADLLLAAPRHQPPQAEFVRSLGRLLKKVGIHRTKKSVTVGPWQIDPRPYDSGPTWQDHHASREDIAGAYRRIRVYLYERESDREARDSVRHAAEREFQAAAGIDHPGLLVPRDLLDHEMGPALVIEQHKDAERLDHFMAGKGAALDLPARLRLVRQLAEAVGYAHNRRLVHRALSPRAVIVEPGAEGWADARVRVGEWQSAARGLSSSSTSNRVVPTTHAARHVEAAAAAYLAPEFAEDADGTVAIDIFGLGATAYLILTGQAPADSRAGLGERLKQEDGLNPSAVVESLPNDLNVTIALATSPRVGDRFADVEDFLQHLDDAIADALPADEGVDPLDAQAGTELPDGYLVTRVLGTGATARAFLVERDGLRSVLKVGRSAKAEQRLDEEAKALEDLRHDHLVVLRRGVFALGSRHAIEIDYAGDESLAQLLKKEGIQLPDQLQSFGEQLLDAVDYLHGKGTFHRDIKPDNLGVRRPAKKAPLLVLFDFSLAGAAADDSIAGTRGYRDPFLGSDRRPVFDEAGDLYSVAATLHEMASLELPTWGDDGTDAQYVDEPTISSEIFAASLRESLTTFFRRALHRDADKRFGSAVAMRKAWSALFTAMDEESPARTSHTETDDPQERLDEAAADATANTALDAAGLSQRAVTVAQRLGADTVGELVAVPTRMLWKARGLSRATRLELVNRASYWRKRLPVAADEPGDAAESRGAGLDGIATRLLPPAGGRGKVTPRETARMLLGLPDGNGELPESRWPSHTDLAATLGREAEELQRLTQKRRIAWLADETVTGIREQLATHLRGRNRVAEASELVEHLLLTRGCDREDDPARRRACGYAVLRAAVEADSVAEEQTFATRRHGERVLVALQVTEDESFDTPNDAELLDMAVALGEEAVRLAAADPLPTPVAVVRALEIVAKRHEQVPAEQRLVQLAAAATTGVLTNARLELFPVDLDPVRALRLSQAGAGVPPDGLTPEALGRRVAARFPGIRPLPDGPDLAKLLNDAGFELHWTGERYAPPSTAEELSSSQTGVSIGGVVPVVSVGESGPDDRLQYALRQGGARVVTFRRSRWAPTSVHIAAVTGAEVVDASAAFVRTLRAVAAERRIPDFGVVLRADAPDADARAQGNLGRLVGEAWERLDQEWAQADVLVLDDLTAFARHDAGTALLNRLLDAARRGGRERGPRVLVLLVAAANEQDAPRIGDQAVGLVTSEEWIVAPSSWAAATSAA